MTPRQPSSPPRAPTAARIRVGAAVRTRAKVLVVDDDPALLRLMVEAFADAGYDTVSADNGLKGVRAAEQHQPDLIVTDIVMPEMEGIGAIMAVKRGPSPPKVIAISGSTSVGSRNYLKWALHLGADEVLEKPFRMSSLLGVSDRLLNPYTA